ncbi:hypothetical protein VCHC57A2_0102, partial [Vibrio cholerae HC-57A2]
MAKRLCKLSRHE